MTSRNAGAPRHNPLRAALRFAFRFLCALVILLDELVRPLYRPLIRRIAALRLMQMFEHWVRSLPAYAVLVLLVVPYAVVEPLKFVALVWIAGGSVRGGGVLFVFAHLVSFVLIERIFSAGKAKLMTIAWMAWLIATASSVRRNVVAWLGLDGLRREAARLWRRLRAALRLWQAER